jgi:DNA polymerase beta
MNSIIINQFELLKKQIEYDISFSTKDRTTNGFRLKAIETVIEILKKIKFKITSSDQLKDMKNIGKNSLKRIDEIIETGKLSEIKIPEHIEKYLKFIEDLQEVYGIGRKTAYDMFKNYNITSIDELKNLYKEKKIELSPTLIKGLKYIDKIKEQIPRSHIDELDEILGEITLKISPELIHIICGSYRRGKQTSNDIDIIIVHTDMITKSETEKHNYLFDFVTMLTKKKIIIENLTENYKTKYMGICKLKNVLRRIDIRFMPFESYYTSIMYFTGSKQFNVKMRNLCISMNYMLNEYGLYNENKKRIEVNSEKDIFDILGMEYIPPELR